MNPLNVEERQTLLRLAREAIQDALAGDGAAERALRQASITTALEQSRGVFVTLRMREGQPDREAGALRGCIGRLRSREPLYRCVMDTAPQSALRDPRFPPLTDDELLRVRIEISVLSPPRPIAGIGALVVGRDGVELQKDGYHAVFLPQVATEQGWDSRQLLERLAIKAGLSSDAWQSASLSAFRAEVFGESPTRHVTRVAE